MLKEFMDNLKYNDIQDYIKSVSIKFKFLKANALASDYDSDATCQPASDPEWTSGASIFGLYHAYTLYIPCICRCPTYTWNIHGESMDIPCISIEMDIHGISMDISMDIPCISTQYTHGIYMKDGAEGANPYQNPDENVVLNSGWPHRFGYAIRSIYSVITWTT